jgi:glycosyltransferase involved in cell wall biosynthesis
MRVLFLCSQPPNAAANGTAQRLHHHLTALSSAHEVVLAFVSSGSDERDALALSEPCQRAMRLTTHRRHVGHSRVGLDPITRLVDLVRSPLPAYVQEWRDPDLIAQIRSLQAHGPYDRVWVGRAYLASAARAAGIKATIVDVDDVEYQSFGRRVRSLGRYKSRPIEQAELVKIRAYEWSLTFRYPAVLVCKDEDRHFFAHPSRVHVLPNGTVVPPRPRVNPAPTVDLLFLGSMGYWPNVDAVEWFVDSVLPKIRAQRPSTTLCVAGRSAHTLTARLSAVDGCSVVSDPEAVGPLYEQARVVVVPMRLGAGTRIKTVEALAFQRPLVSTSAGAEGLGLVHERHVRIADTAESFAAACLDLFARPEHAASLAAAGRQYVEEHLSWEKCSSRAVVLLEQATSL